MRQSWGYLLGQDMSLDELIEKDYLPPKVQTIGLTDRDLPGMAQKKGDQC